MFTLGSRCIDLETLFTVVTYKPVEIDIARLKFVDSARPRDSIATSRNAAAYVTDGRIYTWGYSWGGALAQTKQLVELPTRVFDFIQETFIQVSSGEDFLDRKSVV